MATPKRKGFENTVPSLDELRRLAREGKAVETSHITRLRETPEETIDLDYVIKKAKLPGGEAALECYTLRQVVLKEKTERFEHRTIASITLMKDEAAELVSAILNTLELEGTALANRLQESASTIKDATK